MPILTPGKGKNPLSQDFSSSVELKRPPSVPERRRLLRN
jgi:hypothetical protein